MSERIGRKILGLTLEAALVTGVTLGISQSPQVERAVEALTSPYPECGLVEREQVSYDVIALFRSGGNDSVQTKEDKELYKQVADAHLTNPSNPILIIGNTSGYQNKVILEQIEEFVENKSSGKSRLDPSMVVFLDRSVTYAEGVDNLSEYMRSNNLDNALGISNWYHTSRLNLLGQNFDVNMSMDSVGCYGDTLTPTESEDLGNTIFMERLQIIELAFDPHGKLVTSFTSTVKDLAGQPH